MATNYRCVRRAFAQPLILILALTVFSSVAQAYTVVLKSGRVVQIPNSFSVTTSMVIYEIAPGIQVSLQLVSIDIGATEKANREPAGSLKRRLAERAIPIQRSETTQSQTGGRSITNRELESYARNRHESEIVYERRRQELGLPSLEESRAQAAAELATARQRSEQAKLKEQADEAYWRERAANLIAEREALDFEINSLRQQLSSPRFTNFNSLTSFLPPMVPIAPFGSSVVNPSLLSTTPSPGVFGTMTSGSRLDGRINVAPGSIITNTSPVVRPNPFPRVSPGLHRRGGNFGVSPFLGSFGAFGYQQNDLAYDQSYLLSRLNELTTQKALLDARWRNLEDEARRAGAYPGWLRP